MDAIILAGGKGTRLRSVVADKPKALARIHGEAVLDLLLVQLAQYRDISRVILALGFLADQVIRYYDQDLRWPFRIEFSVEERPLGTAGAVKMALSAARCTGDVFVLNADSYLRVPFDRMRRFHRKAKCQATIAITEVASVARYGAVTFDRSSGRLIKFEEKKVRGERGYINAGYYFMSSELLAGVTLDHATSLEQDIFPVAKNEIAVFPVDGPFIDVGTPEDYAAAQNLLAAEAALVPERKRLEK